MEYGWEQFTKTGKVEDYLSYCAHRQEKKDVWEKKEARQHEKEYCRDRDGYAGYPDRGI